MNFGGAASGARSGTEWVASSPLRCLLQHYLATHRAELPVRGSVDVITGGPPCQGCSGHNCYRDVEEPLRDEKNQQLMVFMDFVQELQPRFVFLENVTGLLGLKGGILARAVVYRLLCCGMQASVQLLVAGEYGVPTSRPRTLIFGARASDGSRLPSPPTPTHVTLNAPRYPTVDKPTQRLTRPPRERLHREGRRHWWAWAKKGPSAPNTAPW